MDIIERVLNGAYILGPKIFNDSRGYFYESFSDKSFSELVGMRCEFIQENQSKSMKGVLRGLHFQKSTSAQSKLVRVVKGSVYDVAVDLRPDSLTFKNWHGLELSDKNHKQFFIPKGFAHGFIALEEDTILQYKVDNYYDPKMEDGIIWNDEELNIDWPDVEITLSEKDNILPTLSNLNFSNLW